MALEIFWTDTAKTGLQRVLEYLEENWTEKEILKLEEKLKVVIQIIILNPEFFPKSTQNPKLFKALIDKNNYIVYRENKEKQRIEIINFRGTRQRPVH
jgi:plasmid stabilization system protein ParE